ncbi:MAG: hypothetical protein LUE61_04210 [Clostridiales bacterium]|nr:hypothetical protein [Clostridiales bacterium]
MYDSADLKAFRTLVGSCSPVWHWVLDPDLQLLESDCPASDAFLRLLTGNGRAEVIVRRWTEKRRPFLLTIQPLLNWVIAFQGAGDTLHAVHAVGPFFSVVNESKNHAKILKDPSLNESDRASVGQWIGELPGVAPAVAISWAQMLHYCLTGEKLTSKDVGGYLSESPTRQPRVHLSVDPFDKQTGNWEFEQEILEKIRKGDLSVLDTIARAGAHTPKTPMRENLEEYRQNGHLLLTLVSRAAVDGGMPQKSAFSLCTEYREKLNASETRGGDGHSHQPNPGGVRPAGPPGAVAGDLLRPHPAGLRVHLQPPGGKADPGAAGPEGGVHPDLSLPAVPPGDRDVHRGLHPPDSSGAGPVLADLYGQKH